jgi:gluconolactonase
MGRRAFGFVAIFATALLEACSADSTSAGSADSGQEGGAGSGSGTSGSGGSSGGSSGGASSAGGSGGSSGGSSGASSGSSGNDGGQDGDAGAAAMDSAVASDVTADDGSPGAVMRFACPPGPFPTPVAGTSQTVCGAFPFKYSLQDGPTWIASEQAFFFSNFVRGAAGPGDIIKYTPGGQCETWLADVGCNGLTAAYDGTLVAACQTPRAVVAFDLVTKQQTTLASMFNNQPLDSPNDIVAHSSGAIFFTNPTYELGSRPMGIGPAELYLDPTGTLNLIAQPPGLQPNGIALSPDERRLYVEEDSAGVKVYDLDAKGVPSASPRPFTGTTDGISVDCAGNLYLSGGAIISPAGAQIGTFPGGGTMAAFGGADGMTLLVIGGGNGTGMQTVQMNVPGPPH